MQRQTILLLFGGESSEHDVSISSARNVYAAIDDTKFDVLLGYIDRAGKWWLIDSLDGEISAGDAVQLVPSMGNREFITLPETQAIRPDVIFAILHGKNGEDGSVQGLAQLLHIPIVGCDMTASSVCMDKILAKQICEANAISVVPSVIYRAGDPTPDFSQLSVHLGLPLFVKPTRSGSSVGVSKVFTEDEFRTALDVALAEDSTVLIERGIAGRELEVAVLGNPPHHKASVVGEIMLADDFYSYEAKYSSESLSQGVMPAEIDSATSDRIRDMARRTYAALGCSGLARVDFFLADDGTVYMNEVNTIPGFTNISMYPKLWRHEGVSYSALIEQLIGFALKKDATLEG